MLCAALPGSSAQPPTTAITTCCRTDSAPQCTVCITRVAPFTQGTRLSSGCVKWFTNAGLSRCTPASLHHIATKDQNTLDPSTGHTANAAALLVLPS